jgi:signal transduction histidine kinase
MFQPFFTTKGERGTGLGLWVITELARANSARLRFHSSQTAPTGTCFCLLVPAHSPQSR